MSLNQSSIANNTYIDINLNPASLSYLQSTEIYGNIQRKFNITKLNVNTLGILIKTPLGNMGIQYNNFGFANYIQHIYQLSFARKLSKAWCMGLSASMICRKLPEPYIQDYNLMIDLGSIIKLGKKVNAGISYSYIAALSSNKTTYFGNAKLGISWKMLPSSSLYMGIISRESTVMNLNFGYEQSITSFGKLFFGLGFFPESISGGFQLVYKHIAFYFSAYWQKELNYTPSVGSSYIFKPSLLHQQH
ncbi:MAG: DUF5777 family beta-barrel protein [Bacteroidales bacterium]